MEPITVVLPRPRSAGVPQAGIAYRRTVSMTAGADEPLRMLADAPTAASVNCHPCDEAIVRHLVAHVGRIDCSLRVDPEVAPGVLAISVRLAVAS
jgi:hypothetical protein